MASKGVSTKLFIGNLPDLCRKEELEAKFEKFGNVVEFDIVSNYGFAHYENANEARAAADAMNSTEYNGNILRVELSHSKVRQKPGMGEKDGCYRCGQEGHWSKDCPRGPRKPRPRSDYRDPYEDDPYYRSPAYADPYYRSRYLPPPPSAYSRYDPYYDPYDRRPLPPPHDPYMRERMSDPYSRYDAAYYYGRSSPSSAAAASGRDPYAKDPYASQRSAPPRDSYDDYMERRKAYAAPTRPAPYQKPVGAASSTSYSSGSGSHYSGAPSGGFTSSQMQSSRVPGPY